MQMQDITEAEAMRKAILDDLCERRNALETWLSRLPHKPTAKEMELFESEMADVRRKWERSYTRRR